MFCLRAPLWVVCWLALVAGAAAADAETAGLLMKRAQRSMLEGEHEDALHRYQTITKLFPASPWSESSWWQIARLSEHLDDPETAFNALQALINAHPGQFVKAHNEQFRLARGILSAAERRARTAVPDSKLAKLGEAEQEVVEGMLRTVIKNGPHAEAAIEAAFTLGVVLERAGKTKEALEQHEHFVDTYPRHELADDAACQVAYIRYKQWKMMKSGSPVERGRARDALRWFLSRYPESERAVLALACLADLKESERRELESLARFYESRGKPEAAAFCRKELESKYPAAEAASGQEDVSHTPESSVR